MRFSAHSCGSVWARICKADYILTLKMNSGSIFKVVFDKSLQKVGHCCNDVLKLIRTNAVEDKLNG